MSLLAIAFLIFVRGISVKDPSGATTGGAMATTGVAAVTGAATVTAGAGAGA